MKDVDDDEDEGPLCILPSFVREDDDDDEEGLLEGTAGGGELKSLLLEPMKRVLNSSKIRVETVPRSF